MDHKRKIWVVGVNWPNIRAGGSLYSNHCFASFHEGEDISDITKHDTSKQFYLFTTRKHAVALLNKIIDIQRVGEQKAQKGE